MSNTESSASKLPPPTLTSLLSVLATEAMASLGQLTRPGADKPTVDRDQAKHFIDLISMLDEKTAGNRTPDESHLLDSILHQLRMAFVEKK